MRALTEFSGASRRLEFSWGQADSKLLRKFIYQAEVLWRRKSPVRRGVGLKTAQSGMTPGRRHSS